MRRLLLYLILFISSIFLTGFIVLYFIDGDVNIKLPTTSIVGTPRKVNFMVENLQTNARWNPLINTKNVNVKNDLLEFENTEYGDIEVSNFGVNHFHDLSQLYKILSIQTIEFVLETSYADRGNMTDVQTTIHGKMPFLLKWYATTFSTDIENTFLQYLRELKKATEAAPDNIAKPSVLENLVQVTESKRVLAGIKTILSNNELVNQNIEAKQMAAVESILKSQNDSLLAIGNPAKIMLSNKDGEETWLVGKNINKTLKISKGISYYQLPENVVKLTHKGDPIMIQNAIDSIKRYCDKKGLTTVGATWLEIIPSNANEIIDSLRIVVHQPIN